MNEYEILIRRTQKTSEMLGSSNSRIAIMEKLAEDYKTNPWNDAVRDIVYDYVLELIQHDEARCRAILDEIGAP